MANSTRFVKGKNVSRRNSSKRELARLAAKFERNKVGFVSPSVLQAAHLFGVSPGYVSSALRGNL
jgi:hypothetical protein